MQVAEDIQHQVNVNLKMAKYDMAESLAEQVLGIFTAGRRERVGMHTNGINTQLKLVVGRRWRKNGGKKRKKEKRKNELVIQTICNYFSTERTNIAFFYRIVHQNLW